MDQEPANVRAHTEILRHVALDVFEKVGRPLRRTHPRRHIYLDGSGRSYRLYTNMNRVLIITTQGAEVDSPIDLEDVHSVIFATPKTPGKLDKIDLYLIPTKRVAMHARHDHRMFLERQTTKGHNTTWQQRFDIKDSLCSGYSRKYAEFRIACVVPRGS
jgi:hypothetical protein